MAATPCLPRLLLLPSLLLLLFLPASHSLDLARHASTHASTPASTHASTHAAATAAVPPTPPNKQYLTDAGHLPGVLSSYDRDVGYGMAAFQDVGPGFMGRKEGQPNMTVAEAAAAAVALAARARRAAAYEESLKHPLCSMGGGGHVDVGGDGDGVATQPQHCVWGTWVYSAHRHHHNQMLR